MRKEDCAYATALLSSPTALDEGVARGVLARGVERAKLLETVERYHPEFLAALPAVDLEAA